MKYLKYLWYIIKHKWFVFVECCRLGIPIRGIMHDMSKFRPSEFFAYANYFYGDATPTKVGNVPPEHYLYGVNEQLGKLQDELKRIKKEEAFDLAWLRHQHRNPHHWQHYVLHEDSGKVATLPMPENVIREMVADWRGADRAITGTDNTASWYKENRDKQLMHPDTRKRVEELLWIK